MGEVIHRVDAPLVPCPVMGGKLNPVKERVPEHHVRMGHVNLGAEDLFALSVFPGLHLAEETKVLFHAAVAPGAVFARLIDRSSTKADFLLGLVVHIGESHGNKLLSPLVELVEIVGGVELPVPLETEPVDIFLDGIHVFGVLLGRVGVIVAKVRLTAVLLGKPEIQADALGVAKVEVSIGLRRETGHNGAYLAGGEVRFDDFFDEIKLPRLFG